MQSTIQSGTVQHASIVPKAYRVSSSSYLPYEIRQIIFEFALARSQTSCFASECAIRQSGKCQSSARHCILLHDCALNRDPEVTDCGNDLGRDWGLNVYLDFYSFKLLQAGGQIQHEATLVLLKCIKIECCYLDASRILPAFKRVPIFNKVLRRRTVDRHCTGKIGSNTIDADTRLQPSISGLMQHMEWRFLYHRSSSGLRDPIKYWCSATELLNGLMTLELQCTHDRPFSQDRVKFALEFGKTKANILAMAEFITSNSKMTELHDMCNLEQEEILFVVKVPRAQS